jgi:nucleotide-binding universal stress UspA family protein
MEKSPLLVAFDGSDHSMLALKEAVQLSEMIDCRIVILNVQPNLNSLHTGLFFSKADMDEYSKEQGEKAIKKAENYLKDQHILYEKLIEIGYPIQVICNVANEIKAKYIVVGSRGLGPIKGQFLGSVSNGILFQASCPVLVIKK